MATQLPPEHVVPPGHETHCCPLRPQANGSKPGWHWPFLQQPGHVMALQVLPTQTPLAHVEPGGQNVHTWPLEPHRVASCCWGNTQTPNSQHPGQVAGLQLGGAQAPF